MCVSVFVILIANLMRPKQFLPHSVCECVGQYNMLTHKYQHTQPPTHTLTERERETVQGRLQWEKINQ